ncbi:MAG TPA: hypothetical protein VGC21_20130 [Telluria sp.]|jgi:hypothetical protein
MPVYVQHEVLGKVSDVFNAEAIWQAPGLALFTRRPLLRDLLERSPRELRGRAAVRCFSHVTLMLAQEELDDDRHLTRGARVRDLAQSLTALHQKDFGDLLGSDDVRYDVIGTEQLAPGEVEVKFGHAVYLPTSGEKILYQVSTSLDGSSWLPVCPMYLNQRLALIGQDGEHASHGAPGWAFGADGAVLLVNDGADTPIEVHVRPKGAFDCSFDPDTGAYAISKRGLQGAAGETLRLLMKIERVQAAAVPAARAIKPAAVWKTRTDATAVPLSQRPRAAVENDATFAPLAQQRVSLVALALPRLSRYRDTGATRLEIGLDPSLRLAAEGLPTAIRFSVDDNDQLHATTGGQSQAIQAPARFSPDGAASVELRAVAPDMADRYCATLMLAQPASMPVACGTRLVFGRSAPMLAALRVLDSPRFLQQSGEAASADRLGLSRSAFSFEATSGGFQIARISPTQALYHLDADLNFVAALGEQAYLLPHGHHLVAGHYVLRFDA